MDRKYLDEVQYKTSANLKKRGNLHGKYGKGDWFDFLAAAADFQAGQRVLDIGCGAGLFWGKTADALPDGLDITLADTSEGMVSEAFNRVRDLARWPGVIGVVADVCDLPFPDDSFDRVLAFHMLYHADDKPTAVKEIARVLKPDGMALISTNGANSMNEADSLRQSAFGAEGPVIDFTLESAPPLLEAQFSNIELRRNGDVLRVTDQEDIYNYLTSFPPGDSAPENELQLLRQQIAERFAAGNGVLPITVETGIFRCR